uniref:Secreted protein n=1 Tax=Anopheles coluzzii TaxID=1518534 RepID=A0A8W7Q3D7_ANOCL
MFTVTFTFRILHQGFATVIGVTIGKHTNYTASELLLLLLLRRQCMRQVPEVRLHPCVTLNLSKINQRLLVIIGLLPVTAIEDGLLLLQCRCQGTHFNLHNWPIDIVGSGSFAITFVLFRRAWFNWSESE